MKNERQILEERLSHTLTHRKLDITNAIRHMEVTGQNLNDFVVPSQLLTFENNDSVRMQFGGEKYTLHRNAVSQLATRFGVTGRDLIAETTGPQWKRQAFADRMNNYALHSPAKNVLIRNVKGESRAILSDKYKRMNTSEIFLAFLRAAQETGSVLIDANHGDLKNFVEVIHPQIIEVPTVKNGIIYIVLGAQIRNSDFGAGKLEVRIFKMNVVCLNGMVSKSMMSNVHLGSRIEQTGAIQFTEETMLADTNARALAVRDVMNSLYSTENLEREQKEILDASYIDMDFISEIKQLPKAGMLVEEVGMLEKLLMEADPDEGLTGKNTLWKFTQGITAVANKVSPDRKRDLQDIASNLITKTV